MTTLHVLSHSPFSDSRFGSCLRLLAPDDALLLSGDAVYALLPDTSQLDALERLASSTALFALDEDLQARGISALPERVQRLDYPGFVECCVRFDKVNSWL